MNSRKLSLMMSVAVASLIIGAPGAFAQVAINQTTTNSSVINQTTTSNVITSGSIGLGGSASVSAGGATSSVSSSAIDTSFNAPTIGTVTQSSVNNGGFISNYPEQILFSGTAPTIGSGASASIGATGAVAGVSIGATTTTGTNGTIAGQTIGNIVQGGTGNTVSNSVQVSNLGQINSSGGAVGLTGSGASASLTSTGAIGSVSVNSLNTDFSSAN